MEVEKRKKRVKKERKVTVKEDDGELGERRDRERNNCSKGK